MTYAVRRRALRALFGLVATIGVVALLPSAASAGEVQPDKCLPTKGCLLSTYFSTETPESLSLIHI